VVIYLEQGANDLHIEGSVHKGSISVYFQFSAFYTIRQITTSPTSLFFSNFATQEKL